MCGSPSPHLLEPGSFTIPTGPCSQQRTESNSLLIEQIREFTEEWFGVSRRPEGEDREVEHVGGCSCGCSLMTWIQLFPVHPPTPTLSPHPAQGSDHDEFCQFSMVPPLQEGDLSHPCSGEGTEAQEARPSWGSLEGMPCFSFMGMSPQNVRSQLKQNCPWSLGLC